MEILIIILLLPAIYVFMIAASTAIRDANIEPMVNMPKENKNTNKSVVDTMTFEEGAQAVHKITNEYKYAIKKCICIMEERGISRYANELKSLPPSKTEMIYEILSNAYTQDIFVGNKPKSIDVLGIAMLLEYRGVVSYALDYMMENSTHTKKGASINAFDARILYNILTRTKFLK